MWGEAKELADLLPERNRHTRLPILGALAREQGEGDLARELLASVLTAGPAMEPGTAYFLPTPRLQQLAAHDRWLAWSGAVLGQAEGQLGWVAYQRAAGDPAQARQAAERALAHASEPRQPLALLAAHRLLGELDTAAGQHDAAQAHFEAALALAEACAAPYERGLTLLAVAELHAAAGRPGMALALLDDVRAICLPLGARPVLARAAALAAAVTASAPTVAGAPPGGYPAGLTAREVEVLRLVAAGKSNRAIAAALSLSVRTIERHNENIGRKTATRSKADATAFAFRHNLA